MKLFRWLSFNLSDHQYTCTYPNRNPCPFEFAWHKATSRKHFHSTTQISICKMHFIVHDVDEGDVNAI